MSFKPYVTVKTAIGSAIEMHGNLDTEDGLYRFRIKREPHQFSVSFLDLPAPHNSGIGCSGDEELEALLTHRLMFM